MRFFRIPKRLGPNLYLGVVVGAPLIGLLAFAVFAAPWLRELLRGGDTMTRREGHYEFVAPKNAAAEIEMAIAQARAFEREFNARFGASLAQVDLDSYGVCTITLLPSHEALVEYGWSDTLKDLTNNGGYFDPTTGKIAIIIRSWTALRHELTHAFIRVMAGSQSAPVSPWISEGFAQYCETWAPNGQGAFGELGGVRPSYRRDVSLGTPLPAIGDIIGTVQGAFRADANTEYYRAAHALVAYSIQTNPSGFFGLLREEISRGRLRPYEVLERLGWDDDLAAHNTNFHQWLLANNP